MIVLAIAKKNELYRWKNTFQKCSIKAVLENDNISFLEYFNGHVNTLREELVTSLFPLDTSVKDRPFLIRDNKDFYTILNRNKRRFKEKYMEIIASKYEEEHKVKSKLKRTK